MFRDLKNSGSCFHSIRVVYAFLTTLAPKTLTVPEIGPTPPLQQLRRQDDLDLIFEILNTMSHLVVAGLRGNAGAGGAMLALAADHIYARSGIVLNPHYRKMGNLYGSEYWTYTLPRRVGETQALELIQSCKPIGAKAALEIGFLDDTFGEDPGLSSRN